MKPLLVNNRAVNNRAANNKIRLQSRRQHRPSRVAILLIALVLTPIAASCYSYDRSSSTDKSAVADVTSKIDSDETPTWYPNAYVTWTSDYVYRGVSLTETNPTWQAGVDIAHRSGLFAGAWTSAIDFSPPVGPNTEHNVFAGYGREFGMAWSGSVRLTHFDFRGGKVGPDSTFDQWQVDVQYNKATTLRVFQADNTYGLRFFSRTIELQHVVPIGDHWLLNGLFGQWDDLQTLGVDHYNYVELGGSWSMQHVNIALEYHHADSRSRAVYGDATKPGWLMSATYRIF
jgi:uncharacterized protein (TIGR02001 family)